MSGAFCSMARFWQRRIEWKLRSWVVVGASLIAHERNAGSATMWSASNKRCCTLQTHHLLVLKQLMDMTGNAARGKEKA
jgi:hypothetical protein